MWKIKQRLCPSKDLYNVPVAKLNKEGDLISTKKDLLDLHKTEYKFRLRHRQMEPAMINLRVLKENLFDLD